MRSPAQAVTSTLKEAKARAGAYRDDEDGSLIIFSMFIFFTMILFGGVAVDLMMYENKRTNIQNTTDSAVLAAANLNQTIPPERVVVDTLAKKGIIISEDDVTVVEVGTAPVITGRQVSVRVSADYDTVLMNMLGIDTLPYSAVSEAQEAINDIEVSLILDVSGSMGDNNKLSRMQTAAKDFVSGVLAGAIDNRVSVSLIPYSTQVSAGPELISQVARQESHGFSHCLNFPYSAASATDPMFDTTVLDDPDLVQTSPYDFWAGPYDATSPSQPICRKEDYFHIRPWSNNEAAINAQIDAFEAQGNTSIDVAVKWGAALLDPTMNDELVALADGGEDIDPAFRVRPHAYSFEDGLKFIVVMTDGINTDQYYVPDTYKTGLAFRPGRTPANGGYYLNPDDNTVWMEQQEYYDRDKDGDGWEPWYNLTDREYGDGPGGSAVQLDWNGFWGRITDASRAFAEYHHRYWSSRYWNNRQRLTGTHIDADVKDDRLDAICTAAKDQGVVVFTIGFEVTDHSAGVMRSCASTPQHFYRVEGLDIEYAFASIKNQINQLKLTQ